MTTKIKNQLQMLDIRKDGLTTVRLFAPSCPRDRETCAAHEGMLPDDLLNTSLRRTTGLGLKDVPTAINHDAVCRG